MPRVSLTFDNGPTEGVTDRVLDILAREAVKATFFVLGKNIEDKAGRRLAERARAEGHRIANHTYAHAKPLGQLGAAASVEEIARTQKLLGTLAPQKLFRPFGEARIGSHLLSRAAFEHLQTHGFTCVLWNAVPRDWENPDGWVETALSQCKATPWSLLVLHDVETGAMRHLPRFIEAIRRRGMEFVDGYPPDCVPILNGVAKSGAEAFVADTPSS